MAPVCLLTLATHSNTRHVARLVQSCCGSSGYSAHEAARIELAVVEALNNVVEHADASGGLEVTLTETDSGLHVSLQHDGSPQPDAPLAPEAHLPASGFGLHLVHAIAADVSQTWVNGQTVLTLTFAPAASRTAPCTA